MGWFRRKKPYDRSRLLADATRARKRGKRHKAIDLYRELLGREPENPDLHRRIAPLLAETKQPAEAWASYRRAADGLVLKGFVEQAVGVLREASVRLPREQQVWVAIADLELQRGRAVDAHRALLEGSRHFRSRRHRAQAVSLLLRARKLAPRDFATSYELAGLLARAGARARAEKLLAELAGFTRGRELRRVRARQFSLSPTPAAAWRWLRVIFSAAPG